MRHFWIFKCQKIYPVFGAGTCSNVFDVVISRRCNLFRTGQSDNCQSSEICCFHLPSDVDKIATPEMSFDQVPCGLRRTPELAQRELQRIADEDNFDSIPLKILGGLEAFQNEICWQVICQWTTNANQSINQSINRTNNQSINQSINQSVNRSNNQSINQPINHWQNCS